MSAVSPKVLAHYGRKGGAASRKHHVVYVYIDKHPWTYEQLSFELEIDTASARARVLRLKHLNQRITLPRLRKLRLGEHTRPSTAPLAPRSPGIVVVDSRRHPDHGEMIIPHRARMGIRA